ncbi:MAG: hypothetical protein HYU60_05600 [Magnetospirillum sp.]|nr:hypothetical protein [Magnetospirillum sp.]
MVRILSTFCLVMLLASAGTAAEPPVCWLVMYRWTDYNQRSDLGTYTMVTASRLFGTADRQRAQSEINRGLPKATTARVLGSSQVDCPERLKATDWRDYVRNGLRQRPGGDDVRY